MKVTAHRRRRCCVVVGWMRTRGEDEDKGDSTSASAWGGRGRGRRARARATALLLLSPFVVIVPSSSRCRVVRCVVCHRLSSVEVEVRAG